MNCSIRNGKLVHSCRFKPEAASVQARTNWRAGTDPACYQTTYGAAAADALAPGGCVPMPRLDKNASHKEDIQGSYAMSPEDQYATDYRHGFEAGGVPASGFTRTRPLPGFDRLTANRTNYALGVQPPEFSTTTAERFADPRVHGDIVPAVIEPRACCLGQDFDIVTGAPTGGRAARLARLGPRHTLNIEERRALHPTDAYGGALFGTNVDIITGARVARPPAPAAPTEASLMRPKDVGLRTRPW